MSFLMIGSVCKCSQMQQNVKQFIFAENYCRGISSALISAIYFYQTKLLFEQKILSEQMILRRDGLYVCYILFQIIKPKLGINISKVTNVDIGYSLTNIFGT